MSGLAAVCAQLEGAEECRRAQTVCGGEQPVGVELEAALGDQAGRVGLCGGAALAPAAAISTATPRTSAGRSMSVRFGGLLMCIAV